MIEVRFRPAIAESPRRDDLSATDFERLGGEVAVRAITDELLDRIFIDPMIAYLFEDKPKARIRTFEYRYAAEHLGADLRYEGRSMAEAHATVPVFDGHFARRLKLLEETLQAHRVPADIADRWLAHNEAQRALVLQGSCR